MKKYSLHQTLILAAVLVCLSAKSQNAIVDITLNPMGSFKATTSVVKGFATLKQGVVSAQNISVDLNSLKTGIELRDKHTKKYLQTEKFPEALLVSATGQNGKGSGKIKINGITKDVSGTYKIDGGFLNAEFPVNLTDFDIKDINYKGIGVEDEVKLHVKVPVKNSP